MTALFYELFRPVDRYLSFLAVLFSLVGCTIQIFGSVFQLVAQASLGGSAAYLSVFSTPQRQALTLLFLKFQIQTFNVGVVFFACFCLMIGCLIYRSTFLPRILGVLLAVLGLGWLTYLSPSLADSLARYTPPFGFLAELALMLWLLVKGVDVQRWKELAAPNA